MGNAGIERLQTRITETIIPEAKQQLQHYSEEKIFNKNYKNVK